MEISLAPEVEARLAKIASEAGKAADQVVQELVASYVDHDEWFKREVQKGLYSLDGGKFVSHEEVGRQIFEEIIAVASGKKTKSELNGVGEEEFAPWAIGPTL